MSISTYCLEATFRHSAALFKCVESVSQWQQPLATLRHPVFSLDSLLCCTSPLRVSLWKPIPVLSLGSDTGAWALAPCPPILCCGRMRESLFCARKCCLAMISVVNCLCFCLLRTCHCTPLWDLKLPTDLACEWVSECAENFPPSPVPFQGTGPYPEILCLFFIFTFCPTSF